MTVMAKDNEFTAGTVENANVPPPFGVVGVMDAEAVEEMAKSDAMPVVAPAEPATVMVHVIALPTR